jgi:hypothetical protein
MIIDKNQIENVTLSGQLNYLLGFENTRHANEREIAKYAGDLRAGVSTMYIYANDLIEPTILGDITAPILRIVNIRGSPGDLVEETFLNPQYFKLVQKTVSQITIELRTSLGRLIPFQYGDCILCLNFKKQVLI